MAGGNGRANGSGNGGAYVPATRALNVTIAGLSPKQEAFCRLIAIGKTPADAYIGAGYAQTRAATPAWARSESARLMAETHIRERIATLTVAVEPAVQAELAELARENLRSASATRDWVTSSLMAIAEAGMQAVPLLDRDGKATGVTVMADTRGACRALQLIGMELGMFGKGDPDERTDTAAVIAAATAATAIVHDRLARLDSLRADAFKKSAAVVIDADPAASTAH